MSMAQQISIGQTVEFTVFVCGNGRVWNGRGRVPQGSSLVFSGTVIAQTERAIQIRCDVSGRKGWAPKSAVKGSMLADWIAVKLAQECKFQANQAVDCL
jgi:hypothetical protein